MIPTNTEGKSPFRLHPLALTLSFLLSFFLFLPHTTLSLQTCPTHYCTSATADSGDEAEPPATPIRFPFTSAATNRSRRCGYPGFSLACDNRIQQPILTLPSSGYFSVQLIDYLSQLILVTDPDNCLPNRILNLDLAGSPFSGTESRNFTFLNCTNDDSSSPIRAVAAPCLSGSNFTVYMTFHAVRYDRCRVIKSVWAPSLWQLDTGHSGPDLDSASMPLTWDAPDCGDCERRGGSCGFKSNSGLDVKCSVSTSDHGASKMLKYGLILGLGIPGFLSMIVLTFYFSGRIRAYNQRRHQTNTELSPSVFPQPAIVMAGLDGPTIESYPKTLLGESRRLPNPSDALCAICLSEYRAKESLRTIPECNHYFHAQCIDEWLRVNGTCPLCRNSPGK